jgi:hemolysin activation/secretion protein
VQPGQASGGRLALDNFGSRHTGRFRLGVDTFLNNPLDRGDRLNINALSSGANMNYARLAYESALGGSGGRLGGSMAALRYGLGGLLTNLNASGSSRSAALTWNQPLLRSIESNVYVKLSADETRLDERIDAAGVRNDRLTRALGLALWGDLRGPLATGVGITWSAVVTSGQVSLRDLDAATADADSARTAGRFTKWNFSASQPIDLGVLGGLQLSVSAQWSNRNLDSSQKMVFGGPYSVRAFDGGVVSADIGSLLSMEYRLRGISMNRGQLQIVAFWDSGYAFVNRRPWAAGRNVLNLNGGGLGIAWVDADQWQFRGTLAAPAGSGARLTGSTNSARAWAELARAF